MAKSDEGEFELILGNRQLISVFLIVVVLLGVFFSMGYIVGRNSAAPAAEAAHNTAKPVAVEPPTAEPPAPATTTAAPTQEPTANPATNPLLDTPTPPTGTTHPEQPAVSKPAPAKPAPTPVKPSPVAPAKPKPTAVGPASVTGAPAAGEYWQVVATSRPDAEIISEALTKKGFHTQITPAPREGTFRVLVGPFKDSATQAQTRTSLEAAGFKNPIMRKY